LPVLGASGLIVFGARVEQSIRHWLGGGTDLTGWIWLAGQALRYGAPFASFVVVTMILYYFGPNRKQGLRNVAPGAILATLLWLLATSVFAWYVRNVGKYNVLYGSVGAGLALLVWIYVLAIIALFGCEFNAASEKARQALVPPPGDEMELI
jgi:membrane protein